MEQDQQASALVEEYERLRIIHNSLPEGCRADSRVLRWSRKLRAAIENRDWAEIVKRAPYVVSSLKFCIDVHEDRLRQAQLQADTDLALIYEVRKLRILCHGYNGWDQPNKPDTTVEKIDPQELRFTDLGPVKQRLLLAGRFGWSDPSEELPGGVLANQWPPINEPSRHTSSSGDNGSFGGYGLMPTKTIGGGQHTVHKSLDGFGREDCITVNGEEFAITSRGYDHYVGESTDYGSRNRIKIDDFGRVSPDD